MAIEMHDLAGAEVIARRGMEYTIASLRPWWPLQQCGIRRRLRYM
jgi:hypothetical protein